MSKATRCFSCGGRSWHGKQCRACKRFGWVLSVEEREALDKWRLGDPWPLPDSDDPDLVVPCLLMDLPTALRPAPQILGAGKSDSRPLEKGK
jgi:hypothetical protein